MSPRQEASPEEIRKLEQKLLTTIRGHAKTSEVTYYETLRWAYDLIDAVAQDNRTQYEISAAMPLKSKNRIVSLLLFSGFYGLMIIAFLISLKLAKYLGILV
jgi:hypothetical protein